MSTLSSTSTFYQPPPSSLPSSTITTTYTHHPLSARRRPAYKTPQQYFPSPTHSICNDLSTALNNTYSFGTDQPLFDFPHQDLMQSEQSNAWSNGQLTPTSTSRPYHHRESSLSSLGSAGPSSPKYPTANTSIPHVVGDNHDFPEYQPVSAKPLTPAHTPSQEHFLLPNYPTFYSNQLPFNMGHDSLSKVASHDSPSTPPSFEEERSKHAFRSSVPKLDRTMTDIYADELYNPNFQITSAPSAPAPVMSAVQNDVFTQRLQAANNQHLSASNAQISLSIPSRERSPFRQGSPLAPSVTGFGIQSPNMRFGTATHMREQQKAENDARALQQQMERTSPEHSTPKTISPKDVDLVYHEDDKDTHMSLFPTQPRHSPTVYRQQISSQMMSPEFDDAASQQSYGSMASSRQESSSTYSTPIHTAQQQVSFNFAPPSVPGAVRQIPQQYPFVPQSRRQPNNNLSTVADEFPASLVSMDSSGSEYAAGEVSGNKKPAGTSADSGTYTCTYHGCTLRFETPAKLQRHKREGHRNFAALAGGVGEDNGMTSAALRNTQNGPHKCERINPSTGKPCNTIFSRPYDLTRHEDTIHNARKQKVRCHLCTEEKTFSRNDALTRHFRVCHPDHVNLGKNRRRGARD